MSQLNDQISPELKIKPNAKVGIVVSRYNVDVTNALLESCQQTLIEHGVKSENIIIKNAPGAFELPFLCQQLTANCDAVIGLGCIIRGETSHYDHIADAVAHGMINVGLKTDTPTIFGVLTVENEQQAQDRIKDGKRGDKGVEAALSALQMIQI